MPLPPRFDHDEARRLRAAGWTYRALAARYGVSYSGVQRVCNPAVRARMNAHTNRRLRDKRQPCLGGCGRLVWLHGPIIRSGYCPQCLAAKQRAETKVQHGTETRYGRYGCRCDMCRAASAEARRRRRKATA